MERENRAESREADRLVRIVLRFAAGAALFTQPVSAQSSGSDGLSFVNLPCEPPESLMPLFQLLDSLVQLGLLGGIGLGTLGFVIAGICYIIPGQDWNRRGRTIAKGTFGGVIILLSAQFIISFLAGELGGVICG